MPLRTSRARWAAALLLVLPIVGCGRRDDLPDPEPAARARAARAAAHPAPPPRAPTADELAHLTREDCLRLAFADNRPFRVSRSALRRANEGVVIAQSQVYAPKLTASYTMSNRDPDQGVGHVGLATPVGGFVVEPFADVNYLQEASTALGVGTYQSDAGVSVSRRLLGVAQHRAQRLPITTAETAWLQAANALVLDRKRVAADVAHRFFALQSALAHERVRERRVEDARGFLQAVRDDVRLGFKAPVEELQAEISLDQAEADLLGDRDAVRGAREALLALLAQPIGGEVTIVEEDVASARIATPPLADDLARLLADHEDLGNRLLDLRLRLENLVVQRDQVWPDLNAALIGERRKIGSKPFAGEVADESVVALSLTYAMPLDFERGARARVRQLDAEVAELRLELDDARTSLESRLRAAHRLIVQLGAQVELAGRRLEAERGKMAVTLARYKAGTIDNLEVVRAKQDLDNAEIGLSDARINLVLADADYRALLPAPLVAADEPPAADGRAPADPARAAAQRADAEQPAPAAPSP